jgi:hypothetical protein
MSLKGQKPTSDIEALWLVTSDSAVAVFRRRLRGQLTTVRVVAVPKHLGLL